MMEAYFQTCAAAVIFKVKLRTLLEDSQERNIITQKIRYEWELIQQSIQDFCSRDFLCLLFNNRIQLTVPLPYFLCSSSEETL